MRAAAASSRGAASSSPAARSAASSSAALRDQTGSAPERSLTVAATLSNAGLASMKPQAEEMSRGYGHQQPGFPGRARWANGA